MNLKKDRLNEARRYLRYAMQKHAGLGRYFRKYGVDASANIPITGSIAALVAADSRGVRLALAEVHQRQGRWREALDDLARLHRNDGDDPLVRLSIVELLVEERGDERACKRAVRIAEGVENVSEVHAGVLYYKGRALRGLGLPTAARDALTAAFRRKKDRSDELLRAIRYERALAYEELGRKSRSRGELEKLYAADPDYEDVAQRLGL